ncbi:hypothetical protein LTDYDHKI_CDS0030 [Exiguobacterium phage phiExGM16]
MPSGRVECSGRSRSRGTPAQRAPADAGRFSVGRARDTPPQSSFSPDQSQKYSE